MTYRKWVRDVIVFLIWIPIAFAGAFLWQKLLESATQDWVQGGIVLGGYITVLVLAGIVVYLVDLLYKRACCTKLA